MSKQKISELLREKVVLKQQVSEVTAAGFVVMKQELKALVAELQQEIKKNGQQVPVEYKEQGEHQAEVMIGEDYLVFAVQSRVFTFDGEHEVWKQSYVKEDPNRSFVGKIHVYNFLSESFTFNRSNDLGYLIARIFVNKDNHFFVEGKRQLGFLYDDFSHSLWDAEAIRKVVESVLLFSLDFDSFTPPYENVQQVSVADLQESSFQARLATGKRLGFRFQTDTGSR